MNKVQELGWLIVDLFGLIGLFAVYMFTRIIKSFTWWTSVMKFKYWKHSTVQIKKDMTLTILYLVPMSIVYLFGWIWVTLVIFLYFVATIVGVIYIKRKQSKIRNV